MTWILKTPQPLPFNANAGPVPCSQTLYTFGLKVGWRRYSTQLICSNTSGVASMNTFHDHRSCATRLEVLLAEIRKGCRAGRGAGCGGGAAGRVSCAPLAAGALPLISS